MLQWQTRSAPSPLVGEGWGGGWYRCVRSHSPHPQPLPTRDPTRGRGAHRDCGTIVAGIIVTRRESGLSWGARLVVLVPYFWLALLLLVPFLIVLKLSLAQPAL